jgi:hypothetical protein
MLQKGLCCVHERRRATARRAADSRAAIDPVSDDARAGGCGGRAAEAAGGVMDYMTDDWPALPPLSAHLRRPDADAAQAG